MRGRHGVPVPRTAQLHQSAPAPCRHPSQNKHSLLQRGVLPPQRIPSTQRIQRPPAVGPDAQRAAASGQACVPLKHQHGQARSVQRHACRQAARARAGHDHRSTQVALPQASGIKQRFWWQGVCCCTCCCCCCGRLRAVLLPQGSAAKQRQRRQLGAHQSASRLLAGRDPASCRAAWGGRQRCKWHRAWQRGGGALKAALGGPALVMLDDVVNWDAPSSFWAPPQPPPCCARAQQPRRQCQMPRPAPAPASLAGYH